MSEKKDATPKPVIIIGAGLSGLYAAKILADKNVPVLLLEAEDRVGGRSFTEKTKLDTGDYVTVDQGAGYVGGTQRKVRELCESFGIKTHPVPGDFFCSKTKFTFSLGGVVHHNKCPLADLVLYLNPLEFIAIVDTIFKTFLLGVCIPHKCPWNSLHATKWDAMTWSNWLDECFPRKCGLFDNARKIFEFVSRTPLGIEPPETSLLYYLWYIKAADNLFRLLFFAQDKFVIGGTQQISEKLLDHLKNADAKFAEVKLSHPVAHINHGENGVTVLANNQSYQGDRVLLAVTPHVRSRISYSPLVSPKHNQLCQRSPMGTTIKVHLFYTQHIWMNDGYNGNCTIFDGNSVSQVYDVSEPDSKYYCLQAFYVGDAGRLAAGMTQEERKTDVMNEMKRVFGGSDKYLHPVGYADYVWDNHTYIGGAPVGTCSTGTLTNFGEALRKPTGSGRIHYAGTETSSGWVGYMEGALRAGERAANEILKERGIDHDEVPEPDNSLSKEALASFQLFLSYAAKAAKRIPEVATRVQSRFTVSSEQNYLKTATDSFIQKRDFDNTDNWLVNYLQENPEDAAYLYEGFTELDSFKDKL